MEFSTGARNIFQCKGFQNFLGHRISFLRGGGVEFLMKNKILMIENWLHSSESFLPYCFIESFSVTHLKSVPLNSVEHNLINCSLVAAS